MAKTRRSSLEVTESQLAQLEDLEARKEKLEKLLAKNLHKPIHYALVKAIAEVALMIVSVVRALKRRGKKRKS